MKRSEIHSFVEAYLAHRGARLVRRGPTLLEVSPPPRADGQGGLDGHGDSEGTGGDGSALLARLLAFGPRAHHDHPEAELVAVGSAYLDRLVGEATRAGRYTVVYAHTPPLPAQAPQLRGLPAVEGARWGRPRPGYHPVFLFVYVAEFRTIDVPDDLVMIGLDPTRGEVLANPEALLAEIRAASPQPTGGWEELSALPSRGTWLRSLRLLDRRLQRRARTFKDAATIEIARETANIEAYYRRLIDEVRHPVGRGRMTPEEESKRVHSLQLDWKRRVQEVARFWEAGVFVRLSALGVLMRPCWLVPLAGRGVRPFLTADLAGGSLWEPRCPICDRHVRSRAAAVGGDLVCAAHAEPVAQQPVAP